MMQARQFTATSLVKRSDLVLSAVHRDETSGADAFAPGFHLDRHSGVCFPGSRNKSELGFCRDPTPSHALGASSAIS